MKYTTCQSRLPKWCRMYRSADLDILENLGEWILIKLFGGKQGSINKDDVKL